MNDKKNKEIDIISKATDGGEDVNALKAEIERLKEENATLEAKLQKAVSERNTYEGWWSSGNTERDNLKKIVKSLVNYAGLA